MIQRHAELVDREKVGLLVVDIQERINQVMLQPEAVVANGVKLIRGFKILNRPIFITEQYPKGLGPTNSEILQALPEATNIISKLSFSACGAEGLLPQIEKHRLSQIVVTGIETHVCIFQTAMDLLANGYQVYLPVDALSSRKEIDRQIAIERATRAGVICTTTEMILFEMLKEAGTDEFKAISKLVK